MSAYSYRHWKVHKAVKPRSNHGAFRKNDRKIKTDEELQPIINRYLTVIDTIKPDKFHLHVTVRLSCGDKLVRRSSASPEHR
jgi:hypothetical protein